ncbi:hypothetical protein OA92_07285 [Marinomonas sp. SBI22]|uniref:SAM-dependent methyltransferase n=1 Tax=unclassified Marinomonas TaxID=196814 RepID=UPI0007AF2BDC|nr:MULTISPECIES: SAM-dependent methyltransferase [unclassified Marinomonas]KZM40417.1 hypothetical protein OA91_19485 [Marinomonas sp. SBI8L]KZM43508.1 hypothetical protein OA92_07285 [Marinomonas sp. SBI22]
MNECEITRYLKHAVLNENFRRLVDDDIEKSFQDYKLTEVEKSILRERSLDMTKLVSTAINDILTNLVGNSHEKWGVDEPVDYVTTQQSVMVRLITVIPPPPVTITPPPPPPTTRPSKKTKAEHFSIAAPDFKGLADKVFHEDGEDRYTKVLNLITELSEKGYLDSSITQPNKDTKDVDIYIVGLGIMNVDQITREAEYILSKSKTVLYVENGIGVDEFLKSKCENAINLVSEYEEDQDRMIAYRAMAAKVLDTALEGGPITFGLYGHPTVFAYPPFLIKQAADLLGLKVKVVPGISAMDCIFTDLMIDPGTAGMQMYEATELLMRERPLHNDVPALIWQIGAIETALYSQMPSNAQRFERFKEYLLKFYPAEHTVHSIYCSNYFMMPATLHSFKIEDIGDYAEQLHAGHTLYIPPCEYREVVDEYLAKDIMDVEHLKKITGGG